MTAADGYVLIALCLIPLGVSMLLFLVPTSQRSSVIALTGISSLAMLALSLYVFFKYAFNGEQFQGVLAWTWMQNVGLLGEKGIQFKVGVDGIGASLVLLTGVVIVPATWVTWKIQDRMKDYFILLYLVTAGVYGAFVILDLFLSLIHI